MTDAGRGNGEEVERRWHSNVNWAALGVVMSLIVNVVIIVWFAATQAKTTTNVVEHLQLIAQTQVRMQERQVSADSALVAALNGHEVRIVRLEERTHTSP